MRTDSHEFEPLLLLHAAGELSSADRRALDARLASDPELAAVAADLERALSTVDASFAAADRVGRADASRAANRAAAAVRQWQVKRAVAGDGRADDAGVGSLAGPVFAGPHRAPPRRWALPAAAAAAVALLAAGTVWLSRPDDPADRGNYAISNSQPANDAVPDADELKDKLTISAVTSLASVPGGGPEDAAALPEASESPLPPEPVGSGLAAAGPDGSFFEVPLRADAEPGS